MTQPSSSAARLRTVGRVAITVTTLAAVTTGVLVTRGGPAVDPGRPLGLTAELALPGEGAAAADAGPVGADVPAREAARSGAAGRQQAERERAEAAARAEQQRAEAAARAERERVEAATRDAVRDPRGAARTMLAAHGWGSGQFSCLDALWNRESGWNPRARNPGSGAFGIAQALPAGKMASAGSDWATNPLTQIRWGLQYIDEVYGSPCGAWSHSQATGWY